MCLLGRTDDFIGNIWDTGGIRRLQHDMAYVGTMYGIVLISGCASLYAVWQPVWFAQMTDMEIIILLIDTLAIKIHSANNNELWHYTHIDDVRHYEMH